MKGLIDVQLGSGMWPQLLASTDSRNWEESSGTSMFLFALFTGLELGILDKATYLEPAKKGWTAVAKQLSSDGKLNNIAAGFWPSKGTTDEYLSASKAAAGNSHGTAGFLWAATAVVKYFNAATPVSGECFSIGRASDGSPPVASFQSDVFFDLQGRTIVSAASRADVAHLTPGVIIHRTSAGQTPLTFTGSR